MSPDTKHQGDETQRPVSHLSIKEITILWAVGGVHTRDRRQEVLDTVVSGSEDQGRAGKEAIEAEQKQWAQGRLVCGRHSVNMHWGSHLPGAEHFCPQNLRAELRGRGRQAKPQQLWASPRWTQVSKSTGTTGGLLAPTGSWSTHSESLNYSSSHLSVYRSDAPANFQQPRTLSIQLWLLVPRHWAWYSRDTQWMLAERMAGLGWEGGSVGKNPPP